MKTKDMVLIALFTALTAVGAFLNIPTPTVPFSLQLFFCAYAGILLGSRRAFLSQLLYVAIGLMGIPIFTKGGGPGYVFQLSFGFILGFMACAFVIGFIMERFKKPGLFVTAIAVFAGLLVMYVIGVPYLYFMYNFNYVAQSANKITFATAVAWGFTPFIVFDLIKGAIVALSSVKILSILKKQGYDL